MNTHAVMTDESELLARALRRERLARKKAETLLEDRARELYKSQQEVRDHYESLRTTQMQLVQSEKMASIGQLAAGVAHEINNPIGFVTSNVATLAEYLTVIRGLLESYGTLTDLLAEQPDVVPEVQTLLQSIRHTVQTEDLDYIVSDTTDLLRESQDGLCRVREIVQNLKSFVRLDQSPVQEADINEGIETTLKVVWNELKYKCKIQKRLSPLPPLRCCPGELNQVFANLLVNAAQAMEQGEIVIESSANETHVVVRISDNGCGISPDNLAKLFTPFFTTKPVGSGTGLGLSVSYGIIQKHGGEIVVESQVGQGTTFTIQLPLQGGPL